MIEWAKTRLGFRGLMTNFGALSDSTLTVFDAIRYVPYP
jgi:hypothetical protein